MSNILYFADDCEDQLKIFESAAKADGNTVETFHNADLAIAARKSPPVPSMVFVDIQKIKESFRVVGRIRQSKLFQIPIVILSSNSNYKIVQRFRELGANLYIQKGTSSIKLKRAIEFALGINWKKAETSTKNFYFNTWL